MNGLRNQLITTLITATVTFVAAIIAIPSDFVVGRFKFALNKADMRADKYVGIATSISAYLFTAQVFEDYFANDITDPTSLNTQVSEYNTAITKLHTDQYVNRAILRKFWSKRASRDFENLMITINDVDATVHTANPALNSYLIALKDPKKPAALDTASTRAVAAHLKPKLQLLQRQAETLLTALADD